MILVAVIGFLASLPIFQQFFGGIIQWVVNRIVEVMIISSNAANMTFGRIIFDIAIIMLVLYIFAPYMFLFQNLFLQGIIIQACTIAEYAQKQTKFVISPDKRELSIVEIILTKIIKVLTFLFGK